MVLKDYCYQINHRSSWYSNVYNKGTISVDGEDITNEKPSKIVEKGIAQVLEGRGFCRIVCCRKSEVGRTC